MISREELELLISGAVQQSAMGIERAHGRALTRTELEGMSAAVGVAMRMVADRCSATAAKLPPPPPYRERRPGQFFNPLRTDLIERVTPEAEAAAKAQK